MGFFNLNTILYTIRKVSKYILLSLFIIAFIIVCLLLMGSNVHAITEPIVYNSKRGYNDESSLYTDKFNVNYTINTDNTIKISGTMGTQGNPTEVQSMDYTFSVDFFDVDYRYIPWVYHDYNVRHYMLFKVPRDSTCYAFNYGINNTFTSFYCGFYCDEAYSVYEKGNLVSSKTAGSIYHVNYLSSYPLCLTFDRQTQDNVLYNPLNESLGPENPPYISLPNDSTTNFINGEFSQFMVVSYNDIDFLSFHLEASPDIEPITNSLHIILDENSPYYLSNYTPEDGGKVFLIPKFDLPLGYVDDTDYDMWLGYEYNDNLYTTEVISWTTSFSSTAIENDRIRVQSGMADSLSNVQNFISSDKINENDINLPSVQFDFNQDHFVSDLFTALRNAFTGEQYNDFEFTLPFSEEKIIISSNYIEEHCPVVILNLIRLFYWYIIGRFMLKDVFRTVDKMRQGDWFLRSEGNIKTEVL